MRTEPRASRPCSRRAACAPPASHSVERASNIVSLPNAILPTTSSTWRRSRFGVRAGTAAFAPLVMSSNPSPPARAHILRSHSNPSCPTQAFPKRQRLPHGRSRQDARNSTQDACAPQASHRLSQTESLKRGDRALPACRLLHPAEGIQSNVPPTSQASPTQFFPPRPPPGDEVALECARAPPLWRPL